MKNLTFLSIILCIFLFTFQAAGFYETTTPLPSPRQMYGCAVLGDYVYVLGGNTTDGFVSEVLKAPVMSGGKLGQWSRTTSMPHPRAYIGNTTLALNDVIYVLGGSDENTGANKKTILWTKPMANGELKPWRESPPVPGTGISCSAGISTPGHIHALGGLSGNISEGGKPVSNVWSAVIDQNGDFVQWRAGPSMPQPLWFHNAAVAGGRVWVWGGLTSPEPTSVNSNIFSAPIMADGAIGQWRTEQVSLPTGFYRCACAASGNYLISFCPSYSGSRTSNDIWYAEVQNGRMSPWKKLDTNLETRVYISVATDYRRGKIYLTGGRRRRKTGFEDVLNTCYIFHLAGKSATTAGASQSGQTAGYTGATGSANLSYQHATTNTGDVLPGFVPYATARSRRQQQSMPMIIYFHLPRSRDCQQQLQIMKQFDFTKYRDKALLVWVNPSLFPQFTQQLGVFKSPTWIRFDVFGNEKERKTGVLSRQELTNWLNLQF